jgi:hypothetical protein
LRLTLFHRLRQKQESVIIKDALAAALARAYSDHQYNQISPF